MEHVTIFGPFLSVLVRMCLLMSSNFQFSKSILSVGEIFQGAGEVFLNYGGCVEHAAIFEALFSGCRQSVGERVSLRGAVSIV